MLTASFLGDFDDSWEGGHEENLSIGRSPSPMSCGSKTHVSVKKPADLAFYPIRYSGLYTLYRELVDSFWPAQVIDLNVDAQQWDKLPTEIRLPMTHILCFFAQFDGVVNENLMSNFQRETSHIKEAGWFYSLQRANETIHSEFYSLIIEAVIKDPVQKEKAYNAINSYPGIGAIKNWIDIYMNDKKSLSERILAFACIEGMIFTGAFAFIYKLKETNLLPGTCKGNEYIGRDEGIHTKFAIALFKILLQRGEIDKLPAEKINEVIHQAVNVASIFLDEAFTYSDGKKIDTPGMNADLLLNYVRTTGNYLAKEFGASTLPFPGLRNPFDWMAIIGLGNKANFFETHPSEYATQGTADFTFNLDAEF